MMNFKKIVLVLTLAGTLGTSDIQAFGWMQTVQRMVKNGTTSLLERVRNFNYGNKILLGTFAALGVASFVITWYDKMVYEKTSLAYQIGECLKKERRAAGRWVVDKTNLKHVEAIKAFFSSQTYVQWFADCEQLGVKEKASKLAVVFKEYCAQGIDSCARSQLQEGRIYELPNSATIQRNIAELQDCLELSAVQLLEGQKTFVVDRIKE